MQTIHNTLLDKDRKMKQAKLDDNLRSMKYFFQSFILCSVYDTVEESVLYKRQQEPEHIETITITAEAAAATKMSTDHISANVIDKVKLKYSGAETDQEHKRATEKASDDQIATKKKDIYSVYLMLVTFHAQEVKLTFASARRMMLNQQKKTTVYKIRCILRSK